MCTKIVGVLCCVVPVMLNASDFVTVSDRYNSSIKFEMKREWYNTVNAQFINLIQSNDVLTKIPSNPVDETGGNFTEIERLFDKETWLNGNQVIPLSSHGNQKWTPLKLACSRNRCSAVVVELLCCNGADPATDGSDGALIGTVCMENILDLEYTNKKHQKPGDPDRAFGAHEIAIKKLAWIRKCLQQKQMLKIDASLKTKLQERIKENQGSELSELYTKLLNDSGFSWVVQ